MGLPGLVGNVSIIGVLELILTSRSASPKPVVGSGVNVLSKIANEKESGVLPASTFVVRLGGGWWFDFGLGEVFKIMWSPFQACVSLVSFMEGDRFLPSRL